MAHEWGHALTQYTADLIYAYQPGALNEAYSDILGTGIATNLFNNEDLILSERTELDSCSSFDYKPRFTLEVYSAARDGTQNLVDTPIAVSNAALWLDGLPGDRLQAAGVGARACGPVDATFEDGDIVLVTRGDCSFFDKLENLIAAGASGMARIIVLCVCV